MKLEPIWKPFTTLKEIPYAGVFLADFEDMGIETTFKSGAGLHRYDGAEPVAYCKLPEDNEFFATLVSETFSATGYVVGITWEDYETTLPIRTDINKEFATKELDFILWFVALERKLNQLTGTRDFRSLLGAIVCIEVTTTVSIQGHLFTNTSESIEFVGELTKSQKNTLWEVSGLKIPIESFEVKFQDFLDEKYQMSGASYEADSRWDNFVETEYVENYSEYVR